MTDRIRTLLITLEEDTRVDDAESLIAATTPTAGS